MKVNYLGKSLPQADRTTDRIIIAMIIASAFAIGIIAGAYLYMAVSPSMLNV